MGQSRSHAKAPEANTGKGRATIKVESVKAKEPPKAQSKRAAATGTDGVPPRKVSKGSGGSGNGGKGSRGGGSGSGGGKSTIGGEKPPIREPLRIEAGSPASVVRNQLEPHEFEFAKEIADFVGGEFIGASKKNLPGIDGTLNGIPVSLKETEGGLSAVLRHASRAESSASKAGINGVDLYIKAQKVDSESLLDFARKGPLINIPNQGTISSINIFTSDGVVRIIGGGI